MLDTTEVINWAYQHRQRVGAGAALALLGLFSVAVLQPLPPKVQAEKILKRAQYDMRAQRLMLATSRGDQRVAFATTTEAQENGISAANLATRWSSPGYSEMYTQHIRGECWSAETKDVQDGSNLHRGLLDAGALHLISCPVGLPMRGAVSASFDYPNPDLEAAIATLKEIAPTLEPLLIPQAETQ